MYITFTKFTILIVLFCFPAAYRTENVINTIGDVLQVYVNEIITSDGASQCSKDLTTLMADARDHRIWALKMLDASGRPGSGMLEGNIRYEGSYDQCISVKNNYKIRGKYCVAAILPADRYVQYFKYLGTADEVSDFMGPHFNRRNISALGEAMFLSNAVCVPDSCNSTDLGTIGNFTVEKMNSPMQMLFLEEACTTGEPLPLPRKTIIAITVYTILAIIIGTSSLYDLLIYQKNASNGNQLFIVFSAISNFKKIFTMSDVKENLACINGIRVISIAWVILGHTFMINGLFPNINALYMFEWKDNIWNSFVLSAPLAVDTFFCMSGLLVVYGYLNARLIKKIKIPLHVFYMHRFLRLTPALAGMVIFYSCLINYMGDGPYWFAVKHLFERNCNEYWWSTLLYIQNYHNSISECVNQSWYLAVDMQMFFLSPIILLPFVKYPKQTLVALFVVIATSAISAFVVTVTYTVGAVPFDVGRIYFTHIYHPTHIRLTAWIVGAVWGYAVFKSKATNFILHKKVAIIGWCLALPTMLIMIVLHVYLGLYDYNKYTAGLFNALVRPIWATGVGWIIFACIHGCGGIINFFLSLRAFGVLAKLTYSMFLVHLPLLIVMKSRQRHSSYFSNLGYFEFWGFYVVSVFLSVVWTIAFESPVMALEKILLKPKYTKVEGSTRNQYSDNLVSVKVSIVNLKKSG